MIKNKDNFNNNLPAGYDGEFVWDIFKKEGCWGNGKIEPMDFDAVVERKKNYLVFETKDKGKSIPQGQKWTLERLKEAKSFTIVLLWPKAPPFESMEIIYGNGKKDEVKGHDKIIAKIAAWYKWADSNSNIMNDEKPQIKSFPTMCAACWKHEAVDFFEGKGYCKECLPKS